MSIQDFRMISYKTDEEIQDAISKALGIPRECVVINYFGGLLGKRYRKITIVIEQ